MACTVFFLPPGFIKSYYVSQLVNDKIIKINDQVSFRVEPRTELFFKKIVRDLVQNKDLNLHVRPDGSTKYNSESDFRFVVIEKFLSVENEFSFREGIILNIYFFLKHLGQLDEQAFGLDKSDVTVELVPLIYQPVRQIDLKRMEVTRKTFQSDPMLVVTLDEKK